MCKIIRRCQCIYQFDKTPSIAQFENPAANASSRPPSVLFYFVPQEKGLIFPSPEYPPFLAVNLTAKQDWLAPSAKEKNHQLQYLKVLSA